MNSMDEKCNAAPGRRTGAEIALDAVLVENDRLRTELACEKVLRAKNHWRDRLLVFAERARLVGIDLPDSASVDEVVAQVEAESTLISDLAAEAGPGDRVPKPAPPRDVLVRLTVADAKACVGLATWIGLQPGVLDCRAGASSFNDLAKRLGSAIRAAYRVSPGGASSGTGRQSSQGLWR